MLTKAGRKLDGGDLQHDDSHRHLRLFHQRVTAASCDTRRTVICNLSSWESMGSDNIKWTWWSLFSLNQLEAFEMVTILANRFMDSITAKMLEVWSDGIEWLPRSSAGARQLVHRHVDIRCFSERPSSLRFFETDIGKRNLAKVGSWIGSRVDESRFIWSANAAARSALDLPRACYLKPRQAGTDRYMHCTQAAMIYAAKPNQNVRSVLRLLGVDPAFWTQTAEYETILQFLTRTSIRNVASGVTAAIYVYSLDQAEYLKRFFDSQPHITSEIEFIDLDLGHPVAKIGRPKDEPISLEEARLKEESRKRRRAEQQRLRRGLRRAA
jgi:hypothetical protein